MSNDTALKIMSEHNVNVVDSVISLTGEVGEEMYEKMVQDLNLLQIYHEGSPELTTVVLSTYGGDLYYGFAIYDYLKRFTDKLKIICSGPVMSAGSLILQAADDRVMMPNSHILVHFGLETNTNTQEKHQHDLLMKQIKKVLIERCTAKEQTVKKWFSKESYFDVKRAISVGLVDREANNG